MRGKTIMFAVSLGVAAGLLLAGILVFAFRGVGNPLGVALCIGAAVIGILYVAVRNSSARTH
ncbi:hypothetical protein [Pseudolysinimonas sp.]|uniref:hypothetical protein n=1 Tax=Pseudolysinimonas sp. TaxID=2680009 RepID=UPI003F7F6263